MQILFMIALATCFLPFAAETPAGNVSPVDLAVALLLLGTVAKAWSKRRLYLRNPWCFAAGLLCFAIFIITQVRAGALETSLMMKFTEFLIIIPFAVATSDISSRNLTEASIAKAIALSALVLSVMIFLSIFSGGQQGFAISIFGQKVNKNALGAILIFGAVASFYLSMHKRFWIIGTIFLLLTTLSIEARSAVLTSLVSIALLFAMNRGAVRAIYTGMVCAILAFVAFGYIASTPAGAYYIERYTEALSLSTNNVTSSSSRLLLWSFAVDKITQEPWLGWGHGTFSYVGWVSWLDGMYEPHNGVLQLLYGGGIVGASSFVAIFVAFSKRALGHPLLTALIFAYILNAMVGILFVRGDGHLFFLIISFAAFALPSRSRKRNEGRQLASSIRAEGETECAPFPA